MVLGRKLSESRVGRENPGFLSFVLILVLAASACCQLTDENVLVLVNENSPVSRYIARMYLEYHPGARQCVLSGLFDTCSSSAEPADEIITRADYNDLIADPVRNWLGDSNYPDRLSQIRVIVTTAGMPYRIEDTTYSNAIYPAGSNPTTVVSQESSIDAASVESELTCLWYSDTGSDPFGIRNRMVNPYQGYRGSSVMLFEKAVPGTKTFNWTLGCSQLSPLVENPLMEGDPPNPRYYIYGTRNRSFHVGDMYLVCRLDGPKKQGPFAFQAIFAVRAMLERAFRASHPYYGVNPAQAVAVFDDSPLCVDNYDRNRTYNLNSNVNYWQYDTCENQPPDCPDPRIEEDYIEGFRQLTALDADDILNIGALAVPDGNVCVMLDRRGHTQTTQTDLDDYMYSNPDRDPYQGIIALATYGVNCDEYRPSNYLLTGGPGGGPLFNLVNGAVFTSIESFNGVTMFSDVNTLSVAQGKLVDFISIGGAGAIGHIFEPQPDAAIDNEFLIYNLLADADSNGVADLTFAEAAYSAIPYLSWSEVVIGDPLMQIQYANGGPAWIKNAGDINRDGKINIKDYYQLKQHYGGELNTADPQEFDLYDDMCDLNEDGKINIKDVHLFKQAF